MKLPTQLLLAMALVVPSVAMADGAVSLADGPVHTETSPAPIANPSVEELTLALVDVAAESITDLAEHAGFVLSTPTPVPVPALDEMQPPPCRMG